MSTNDDEQKRYDVFFKNEVVRAAKLAWGVAWYRLSEDMQRTEIQAQTFKFILGNGRIDETALTSEDAEALGRHVHKVAAAYRRLPEKTWSMA